MKREINLEKVVKEAVEKIVARGCVENEEEQVLISTAALLCESLLSKGVDGEVMMRVQARQCDVGFFFPPLTEAILEWVREGKNEVIGGIRALAAGVRKL